MKASYTVARAAAPAAVRSVPPAGRALPDNERLGELVRSALVVLENSPGYRVAGSPGELARQVLFDIDVDGERYVLIRTAPIGGGARLSPREREIVHMVALGYQNKTIASSLRISAWTVCTHLRRIFAKLRVSSRAAMVAKAAEAAALTELKCP